MDPNVIVVVEDEPRARLAAVDACERAGFDVADFGRTDDALAYVQRTPDRIVAVLTDIDVPGDQDGIDLAVRMAATWPRIRLIVTSGRFGRDAPANLPAGVHYVPKPWTPKSLMEHVRGNAAGPVAQAAADAVSTTSLKGTADGSVAVTHVP